MKKIMLTLIIFTMLSVACGGAGTEAADQPPPYTVISEGDLAPGDPVPAPAGPVVLTITGKISQSNVADTLQFDMETLERIGVVEYAVDDLQAEGRTAVFRGVLLSQLLAVAGIADDATMLNSIALNDYAVDIPLTDVQMYPILLATAVDGERMSIERYGPTRIIYPYHAYDLDETIYDPRWVWQMKTFAVR